MRALVTGAAGFIGRVLCKRLKEEGWHVTANDIYPNRILDIVDETCTGSYSIISANNYDVIFHLGASSLLGPSVKDPLSYFHNNVSNFNSMLMNITLTHQLYGDELPAIIFASSAATYGDPGRDVALKEEDAGHPINPYGWSKWMDEIILEQTCIAHGMRAYSMRFFNVAGSYQGIGQDLDQPHILTKMSIAGAAKEKFYIYGNKYDTFDGTCVRDYIHVADVCDCLIAAANDIVKQPKTSYTEYNVSTGHKTSNLQLAKIFNKSFGLEFDYMDVRPGDPGYLYGDNSNTVKELGWKPTMDIIDIIESHYMHVLEKSR